MDQNQGTIHAVKTEAHLHIPTNDGSIIKIPLAALQQPSHNINISKEMDKSGLWKHISSESYSSLQKVADRYTMVYSSSPSIALIITD